MFFRVSQNVSVLVCTVPLSWNSFWLFPQQSLLGPHCHEQPPWWRSSAFLSLAPLDCQLAEGETRVWLIFASPAGSHVVLCTNRYVNIWVNEWRSKTWSRRGILKELKATFVGLPQPQLLWLIGCLGKDSVLALIRQWLCRWTFPEGGSYYCEALMFST